MRTENLCNSLNYNAVPLLTITAIDTKDNKIAVSHTLIRVRNYIFFKSSNNGHVGSGDSILDRSRTSGRSQFILGRRRMYFAFVGFRRQRFEATQSIRIQNRTDAQRRRRY